MAFLKVHSSIILQDRLHPRKSQLLKLEYLSILCDKSDSLNDELLKLECISIELSNIAFSKFVRSDSTIINFDYDIRKKRQI